MKHQFYLHNMHFNLVSASLKSSKYSEVSSEFSLNFLKFKFNFLNINCLEMKDLFSYHILLIIIVKKSKCVGFGI